MDVMDFSKLERELTASLEEDRKYKATDAMKKRAIKSARSYDEFKNMVACATLKPVTSSDIRDMMKTERRYNRLSSSSASSSLTHALLKDRKDSAGQREKSDQKELTVPKTRIEFEKAWKKLQRQPEQRLRLVEIVKLETIAGFVCSELDPNFLSELLRVLAALEGDQKAVQNQTGKDAPITCSQIQDILHGLLLLSKSKRFRLAVDFFTTDDKENAARVLGFLHKELKRDDREVPEQEVQDVLGVLSELQAAYGGVSLAA